MARKPYLPNPGDVYWVEAVVFYDYDPKPRRPVLVIGVLRPTSEGIAVVTRTTDLASNGVYSAADPSLGLNKPGVWVYKKYARSSLWMFPLVKRRGAVSVAELEAVKARFSL